MRERLWEPPQPTAPKPPGAFIDLMESGTNKMSRSTAVICGLARDSATMLPSTISRIEQLGSLFSEYRVVIFENDSVDDTLRVLGMWQRRNPLVTILTETFGDPVNLPTRCPNRGDRMAHYRNHYRQFIADVYRDFDYAIVVDTDLPGGWDVSGVANTLGHEGWDFVGTYGTILKRYLARERRYHYDAWAFRRYGNFAPLATKYVNRLSWRPGDPLVRVSSCFGGLGVYRMRALLNCRYSGGDCEHVALHREMCEQGMDRLFLNPNQTACYGMRPSRVRRLYENVRRALGSEVAGSALPRMQADALGQLTG